MRIGFGIDGGGTKSRAMLFDVATGQITDQAVGGPTNMHSVGIEGAQKNVRDLLKHICSESALPLDQLVCGCLASAGLGRPQEIESFSGYLSSFLSCPVIVCSDGEALLAGSLNSLEGYALVSGTGSVCLGRNSHGELVRSGGLGHMLGDEGSGYWLGWQAVIRTLRSIEQRDLPSNMLNMLLHHFAVNSQADLVDWFHHRFDKSTVAALAPQIVRAAEQNDPLASDIVEQASHFLYQLLHSVYLQLPLPAYRVALAGGLLLHDNLLRRSLTKRILESWPLSELVFSLPSDATKGACFLAKSLVQ